MSARATISLVDDEEMSLQGSVNAPMATPRTTSPSQILMTQLVETSQGLPLWTGAQPVQVPAPMMQSSVYVGPSGVVATVLVIGGGEPSAIATTIVIDAPSHKETKEAFSEVSFAFPEMSAKHGQIQEGVRALASAVEELRQAKLKQWHRYNKRCRGLLLSPVTWRHVLLLLRCRRNKQRQWLSTCSGQMNK